MAQQALAGSDFAEPGLLGGVGSARGDSAGALPVAGGALCLFSILNAKQQSFQNTFRSKILFLFSSLRCQRDQSDPPLRSSEKKEKIMRAVFLAAIAAVGLASPAFAHHGGYHDQAYAFDECRDNRRGNQVAGAVIGGLIGGIAGNRIAGPGNRAPGSLIGAASGIALGAAGATAASRDCKSLIVKDVHHGQVVNYSQPHFDDGYHDHSACPRGGRFDDFDDGFRPGRQSGFRGDGFNYGRPVVYEPVCVIRKEVVHTRRGKFIEAVKYCQDQRGVWHRN